MCSSSVKGEECVDSYRHRCYAAPAAPETHRYSRSFGVMSRFNFLNAAAFLFLSLFAVATKGEEAAKADRLELMRHSFESPLTYDNNLAEWVFSGAAIPSKNSVVLVPGVGGRTGHIWHKLPLKTSNFELIFQFSISGPEDQAAASQGFSFWYSQEPPEIPPNVKSADGQQEAAVVVPAAGWNLFGHKNTFKGMATFFSLFDRDNKVKSSISYVEGDGTKATDMVSGVPSGDGIYFSPIRNAKEPLVFKLRAGPQGVQGQIRLLSSSAWSDCFKVKAPVAAGGHIGFTASTPFDANAPQKVYELVSIQNLHVFNLDMTQPGEDSEVLSDTLKDVEVGDLLSEHNHAHNPPDVANELRQLSRLVFKSISEQQPRENSIIRHLVTQSATIEQLTTEMRELQKQLGEITGHKPDQVASQVSNELAGLRNLFHSHTKHQETLQQSLSNIQRNMKNPTDLSEFVERSAALEATIKQQATYSSWLILGVIVMIALFALFMWKRMRDMEKKHFL